MLLFASRQISCMFTSYVACHTSRRSCFSHSNSPVAIETGEKVQTKDIYITSEQMEILVKNVYDSFAAFDTLLNMKRTFRRGGKGWSMLSSKNEYKIEARNPLGRLM